MIAVAVAGTVAVASYVAWSFPATDSDVGLVINTPGSVTLQQLDEIYAEASSAGIGRGNVYVFWDVIEPERGRMDWRQYDTLMGLHEKYDLKVTLFLSVINGKTLGPFPDWVDGRTLQTIPAESLADTLDSILSRYHIVDSVIISGGTDEHFRYLEGEIPVYEELFNAVYDAVKERHPDVKMGNSFELHNILNKNLGETVKRLSFGDFVALTYMPTDALGEISRTPAEAAADLEAATDLFAGKKIAFFEAGWSTSPFVGGTEEDQDEFMDVLGDFHTRNGDEIEFVTWYRMYDRPEGECGVKESALEGGLILGNSTFVIERLNSYVCNAGLFTVDGGQKPAWDSFMGR